VGERKKEEHARAHSPRRAGRRECACDVRVNAPPKSGPILAGMRLPFADLFCHFESIMDFTRGIFRTHNRLGFWDAKNPSGFLPINTHVSRRKKKYRRCTTRLELPATPPCTLLHPVRQRAPTIGRAGLRNLILSDHTPGEGE
jgi:hypothetical protein